MNQAEIIVKQSLWVDCRDAYATSLIFKRRRRKYERLQKLINYIGIIIPAGVGFIYMSYGSSDYLISMVKILAAILAVQFIVSVWSLIDQWADKISYSSESMTENEILSKEFETQAQLSTNEKSDIEKLKIRYQSRTSQDERSNITTQERRYGHRQMLYDKSIECGVCKEKPITRKPLTINGQLSTCDNCGNFPKRWIQ